MNENQEQEKPEEPEETSETPEKEQSADDSGGEHSFRDRLYGKAEKRKVRGKVTFVNPEQIRELIDEEVEKKQAEFDDKLQDREKEFADATDRLKMLNKAALFENEELKKKMVDFEKLVADNEAMSEKLEQTAELFEIKKIYDRMLQLAAQCESPEQLKERIEELSRENTSLKERIEVLQRGLEFIGAVNPAPPEKGQELIQTLENSLDRMKDKIGGDVFEQVHREFTLDKKNFTESVVLTNELIKSMEEGGGTVYCVAEIIRNAEMTRGLYDKFRLLSKIAGN